MDFFRQVVAGIVGGCAFLGLWPLLALCGLTVYEVIMRYMFKQGVEWFIEVAGYLCVIVIYLGAAYTLRTGGHVSIELLQSRFSGRFSKYVALIRNSLTTVFCVAMAIGSVWVAIDAVKFKKASTTYLTIPLSPFYMVTALGWILLSLQGMVQILDSVGAREDRESNDG